MAQSRLVLREQVTGCLECAQSGMEETPVKKHVPAIVPAAVRYSLRAARERDCEGAQRGACGTFAVPSG